MSRYERITSEHLEMVRTHTKEELIRDHNQVHERLQLVEKKKTDYDKEMEAKTESLRKEIEKLENKITEIEKPILKLQQTAEKEIELQQKAERDIEMARNIAFATELLKDGITTKDKAIQYIGLYIGRSYCTDTVREVKHERGADIKVWAFKSNWDYMYYFAVKKGAMVSALKVEKARHAGDTTTTHSHGCKKVADFDKKVQQIWSREGICMREWLNKDLVKWTGMNETEVIEFWNSCE